MSVVIGIPPVDVFVDGRALDAAEIHALTSVVVRQRLSQPAQCEITLTGSGGPIERLIGVLPGQGLRLNLPERRTALFDGEITTVEIAYGPTGGRQIILRAYDRLIHLRHRQSIRAFRNQNAADVATELAGAVSLNVSAASRGPTWPLLIQYSGDDLEYIVDTAAQAGLFITLRDNTLHLVSMAGVPGDAVDLALGSSLLEARFELNGNVAAKSVEVIGWNSLTTEVHRRDARRPRSGRNMAADRRLQRRDYVVRSDETAPEPVHAQVHAQAELDYREAAAVTCWGVAGGDPRLQPGTPVDISGVDNDLTGRYVLTDCLHTIDTQLGYVTEFNTEPPSRRSHPRGAAATFGTVSDVTGRNGGRVRVKLPTYNDIETDWLNVLAPAAGSGKGFVALPARGDTVLVLLPRENPSQGVVLGGLFGNQRGVDAGVNGNDVRRYTWITPQGQKIRLDDDDDTIRIENGAGSYIELSGGNIRIVGSAIDFATKL